MDGGKPNGGGNAHDFQQELLVLVAARLAVVPDGRSGFPGRSPVRRRSHARAELLLLSPSFLVPCLTHNGMKVWDTLAIAEYLHESLSEAGLLPEDSRRGRIAAPSSGEMHSGFANLRSALPMNLKARLSRLQGLGRGAGRYRPRRRDLARMPGRPMAVPICSARARRWRTPCMRRCARGSSPMT